MHNNKKKIAFIIDVIQQIGGTETQLILLLENLDRSKFDPYLICLQNSPWLKEQNGKWHIHVVPFRSLYYPGSYWGIYKLSRFFKKEGIEIVQTYFRDSNILGVLAARLAGIKKIISSRRNQGYWHNRFELWLLKLINPLVEKFMANTYAIREYVHNVENVPHEKIDVIYNAIDTSKFSLAASANHYDLYKELEIEQDVPIVTIVANLRPVKAIDDLINAARITVNHNSQVKFLIVGEGPEKQKLTDLVERLELKNHVSFLSTRNDIPDILAISNIGVLCSESEGLSNAVLEYMASGLPVVASNIDGNRELVENGENGFLVPVHTPQKMADALIELIDDKDKAYTMGQKSLEKIHTNFQLESIIKKTENYYFEL